MRTWIWLLPLLVGMGLGGSTRAEAGEKPRPAGTKAKSQDSPRALVEKAVQAMGGVDKLTSPLASRRQVKGVFMKEEHSFTGESFSQGAGKLKLILRSEKPQQETRILVMAGDRGWISMDGVVLNLDDEILAKLKRARHADRVAGLVALLQDKGYTLSLLGESKVKDTAVLGVKVQYAGEPDMHLYFDKTTGLLLKTWQKFTEPGDTKEVVHEMYYLEYHEIDPAAGDEALLKAAGRPLDGPALVHWLRKRVPKGAVKDQIARLIEQLGSNSFRIRARATAELKKFGVEAAPLLREALKNPDEEVSQRAQQALTEIEQDPTVKHIPAAVRLIALRRPAGATAALLQYLPWAPTEEIRGEVQAALFQLAQKDGKPDPDLLQALESKEEATRSAARAALGRDGGAYALKPGRRVPVSGLKLATHSEMYRDGQRHLTMQTLEVEFFNAWPDSTFTRPEPEN